MPVPESILALVPHRAKFTEIFDEAMRAGLTTMESRLYAKLEIDRLILEGKLKGRPTPLFTPPPLVPSEDPTSMFYRGRQDGERAARIIDDKSIDDRSVDETKPLGPNPSHAPRKVDRRPLKLKPRVPPPAPRFPFVKDLRTAAEKAAQS